MIGHEKPGPSGPGEVTVSRVQVEQALQVLQRRAEAQGWVPDRVNLPPGCNELCSLLGAMWFSREELARVRDDGAVAQRLREAFGADFAGAPEPAAPGEPTR